MGCGKPNSKIGSRICIPRRKEQDGKPPSLQPAKAIMLLNQKIEQGTQLLQARYDDHKITEWENSIANLLNMAFGDPNENTRAFYRQGSFVSASGMTDSDYQRQWLSGHEGKLAVLKSAVEQLSWQVDTREVTAGGYAATTSNGAEVDQKSVFLVHGHNDGAKEAVARQLEKHGMKVTILHEQPDRGKTLIEKFEHHSKVPFAVILATADDLGYPKDDSSKLKARPRQNVISEMGFFLGSLGRNSVFVLVEDGVEMPSDYSGVLYIPYRSDNVWRERLISELREAGAHI